MSVEFTAQAFEAFERAHEEAQAFGHGSVEAEHLLLGLVADHGGIAGRVLSAMGITIEPMRDRVRERLGRGSGAQAERPVSLSRSAMELIVAARDAVRTVPTARDEGGEAQLGTEHLLLAVTSERESGAFHVLLGLGVGPDMIRSEVKKRLPTPGSGRAGDSVTLEQLASVPLTPESEIARTFEMDLADAATRRLLVASGQMAREQQRSVVGIRDLIRAIASDAEASRLLADLGVDSDALRARLEGDPPPSC